MKKMILTAVVAVLPFASNAQGADSFMNTHRLLTNLNSMDMSPLSYGYIMGVADADDGSLYCIPGGMTPEYLARVITRAHMDKAGATDHLSQSARTFIRGSLQKAFPCSGVVKVKK